MRNLITTFLSLLLCLTLNFCSINEIKDKEQNTSSLIPAYNDSGKTIDSLKAVYKAQDVEYENWEPDDTTDSSLTVSFINSKRLPAKDVDSSVNEFKAIASSIHRSIVDTGKYKSYYIIFVSRDTMGKLINSSHTAGMDVSVKEL